MRRLRAPSSRMNNNNATTRHRTVREECIFDIVHESSEEIPSQWTLQYVDLKMSCQRVMSKCVSPHSDGCDYSNRALMSARREANTAMHSRQHRLAVHIETIKLLLLEQDANAKTQGGRHGNSLNVATRLGNNNVKAMLMAHGAPQLSSPPRL